MARRTGEVRMIGKITCPECGHIDDMEIPEISCLAFYKCSSCGKTIPAKKSCCVFCDYGDRKCPIAGKHEEGK